MKGVRGELSLAGNGDLDVSGVALDHLIVNSAGGGRIRMAGQAGDARIQVIGAGSIEAPGLTAKTLNIISQGPGSITLTATGTAEVTVNGSRSEEHTSELQSLMRISYAVFCLKKKNTKVKSQHTNNKTQLYSKPHH